MESHVPGAPTWGPERSARRAGPRRELGWGFGTRWPALWARASSVRIPQPSALYPQLWKAISAPRGAYQEFIEFSITERKN